MKCKINTPLEDTKKRWLVEEFATRAAVVPLRLGRKGVSKQINLGLRAVDLDTKYLRAFIDTARSGER